MVSAKPEGEKLDINQMRKEFTKTYYSRLQRAREDGRTVVHSSAMGPMEILSAMDIEVCLPENYVTICSAKQMARGFCEETEKKGYSLDLCSYVRCGLGMVYSDDGPMGAMPKPDFIIATPLACDPHSKWWEIEARHYNVPLFRLDPPFNLRGKIEPYQKEWMISEFKRLISFLEEQTGRRFDYDRFKECMRLSGEANEAFNKMHLLRQHAPCPRSMRETAADFMYIVTQAGRREAVDYYNLLLEETQRKAAAGEGAIPEERYRLYFQNIPLWYNLQTLDYLASKGAVVAIDSYTAHTTNGFYFDGGQFDPESPFESLALKWLNIDNIVGVPVKSERSLRSVRDWKCDGAIFFDNRSCKTYSLGLEEHSRAIEKELGKPSFFFEAEMADPRSFSFDKWKEGIDQFLDGLGKGE